MRGWTILALALLVTPTASADWLQESHDAGRTSRADGPGPGAPDVGRVVTVIAGQNARDLRILDGRAYFLVDFLADAACASAIIIVDIAAGTQERAICAAAPVNAIALGASTLYVVTYEPTPVQAGLPFSRPDVLLRAFDLVDGKPLAEPRWQRSVGNASRQLVMDSCLHIAVTEASLFLGCTAVIGPGNAFVQAFGLDGTQGITWFTSSPLAEGGTPSAGTTIPEVPVPASASSLYEREITALAYANGRLVVSARAFKVPVGADTGASEFFEHWSLDVASGAARWLAGDTLEMEVGRTCNVSRFDYECDEEFAPARALMEGNNVTLVDRLIWGVDSATGALQASSEYTVLTPVTGGIADTDGSIIAALNKKVISKAKSFLHEGIRGSTSIWESEPLRDDEEWVGVPVLAGDVMYAVARGGRGDTLYHMDLSDGHVLWRAPTIPLLSPLAVALAVSDGSAFVLEEGYQEAVLYVVGATPGAMTVRATEASNYPPPGVPAEITLDASPGPSGPATAWGADWGDGTPFEWTANATLVHAYNQFGAITARLYARNDAGETASTLHTFYVGVDPPKGNLVQEALKPENQNTTFFFIGLLLTLLGALFGVVRSGRKRRILERELRALEAASKEFGDDPHAFEAALRERRIIARDLYLARKLEEGHYALLEKRIDEMSGQARLSSLGEGFEFLPIGVAKTLEGMLRDGRISRWERSHFLNAIDGDRILTTEQKALVRDLVDGWFRRDAAAASPGR